MIETVHGRGYRLKVDVEAVDELPRRQGKGGVGARLRMLFDRQAAPLWIAAFLLVLAVTVPWVWGRFEPPPAGAEAFNPHPKSIVVLAFEDLSPTRDQQWFAAGMTEEILNSLARTPDLRVAARTSAEAMGNPDVRSIGRKLNVAYVLEGSLRREGNRVRVTAQLIRSSDGFNLWSQNYDRSAADVIGIQEQLAIAIARSLKTVMKSGKAAGDGGFGHALRRCLRSLSAGSRL